MNWMLIQVSFLVHMFYNHLEIRGNTKAKKAKIKEVMRRCERPELQPHH